MARGRLERLGQEIEHQREKLAHTATDVRHRLAEAAKSRRGEPPMGEKMGKWVRSHPVPLGMLAVGLGWLATNTWRSRRGGGSPDPERLLGEHLAHKSAKESAQAMEAEQFKPHHTDRFEHHTHIADGRPGALDSTSPDPNVLTGEPLSHKGAEESAESFEEEEKRP